MSSDPADLPSSARPEAPEGLERELGLQKVLAGLFGGAQPARELGRFQLEERLGGGGMGEVFRAVDPLLNTTVALKLLSTFEPAALRRFEREALALQSVSHPGIVGYVDHGHTERGRPWLAMDWVDGEDLAHALRDGPLPIASVVQLGLQLAEGLSAAHRANVVHRDLKPSNVMLPHDEGRPQLIDFGIAKDTLPDAARLTSTGVAVGSPSYMAPEQLRGRSDERTDVYGLGATLFEACTGRPPFVGDTQGEVILAVLSEPPPAARALRPEVPRGLEALLGRMLAKDPARRPQDMSSVSAELAILSLARASEPMGLSHREAVTWDGKERLPADTPLLGRARGVGLLRGAMLDVRELGLAGLIEVVGPSGAGRSRLLAQLQSDGFGDVRRVASLPDDQVAPFSLLRRLLNAAALPRPEATFELTALLDQRHAPQPRAHADQVLLAWLSVVEAVADGTSILWVVDDAHFADLASLRLLDRALDRLSNRPLALVLATLEGQELVGERMPRSRTTRVELGPLPRSVMHTLCAGWGVDAALAEGAQGCPGRLLPAATLAMATLGPEARRTLRAAAIAGRVAPQQAIAAVLGVDPMSPLLLESLTRLVERGLVVLEEASTVRFIAESSYRQALEATPQVERADAHRVVAAWMEQNGEPAALVARHWRAAGEPSIAAPHLLRAARASLMAGTPAAAEALLMEAEGVVEQATDWAVLYELRAQCGFWAGDLHGAADAAGRGLGLLAEGSEGWFALASLAVTASGQRGDNQAVAALMQRVFSAVPVGEASKHNRIEALSRGLSQLTAAGRSVNAQWVIELDAVEPDALPANVRAFWWRRDAYQRVGRDLEAGLESYLQANRAHMEAGQAREAVQTRLLISNGYRLTGEFELAQQCLEAVEPTVRRLGTPYLGVWLDYTAGKLLTESGSWGEASERLGAVLRCPAASVRIRFGAHIYRGLAALRHGHPDIAVEHANQVYDADVPEILSLAAHALLVRAHVAMDSAQSAWAPSMEVLVEAGRRDMALPEFDALLGLAVVEGHLAAGQREAARAVHQRTLAALRARCATIPDTTRRARFMAEPYLRGRLLALSEVMQSREEFIDS